MYPQCVVSKKDIGVPGGGIRNDEFRDERLWDKSVRLAQSGGWRGGGSTDCDIPGVCQFPESDGVEERGDVLVFSGIFERFRPCVHNVVDREELVLHFFDGKGFF